MTDSPLLIDLNSLDWVYKVIHRGLFLDEIQQLWSHVRNGTADQIDPAWLALFFMVRPGVVFYCCANDDR